MLTRFQAQPLQLARVEDIELLWLDLDTVAIAPADLCILSSADKARNARYATPLLRQRDLVVRLWVRAMLAARCTIAPEDLSFEAGPHGKPFLRATDGTDPPFFNLSHSANLALIAISDTRDPGVDIECLRAFPADEVDSLAQSIMTPAEQMALAGLPASARSAALLTGWTRKEACVKTLGLGLTMPVHTLQVGLTDQAGDVVTTESGKRCRLRLRTAALGARAVVSVAWRVGEHRA